MSAFAFHTHTRTAMVDSLLTLKSLLTLERNPRAVNSMECNLTEWADYSWAEPFIPDRNVTCGFVSSAVRGTRMELEKNLVDRPADGVDRQIFDLCERIIHDFTDNVLASQRAVTYYNKRVGRPDVRRDALEYAWNPARYNQGICNGPYYADIRNDLGFP